MLQQVEYDPKKFHEWSCRLLRNTQTLQSVATRKRLVITRRSKLLVLATYGFATIFIILYAWLVLVLDFRVLAILVGILALPHVSRYFLEFTAYSAQRLIIAPEQKRMTEEAARIFADHTGVKIAVLGSYGKTTMKELLATILSQGKKVAATPGNMNVSTSHARFARSLKGDEDVLIVEFGEGEPGDIERMAQMFMPDYAIITGLAPNHLDYYPDLKAVAKDLLSIYDFVPADKVLVSGESKMLKDFLPKAANVFTTSGTLGWKTSNIKPTIAGVTFDLNKAKSQFKLASGLLGRYQVAPLALVAALADKLGMSKSDIEAGMKKTAPFQHRMQPRLINGAWLIDDAYNGNLEGMQAGLKLLAELPAKRKWYVTPGLVDQGVETVRVHKELGKAIAESNPNIVVLMNNSARPIIEEAMLNEGFKNELRVETNPLDFYVQIEHLVASGDVLLMQNDWTDNYS
ncbi:hypothetical protein KC959_01090 [Candidatus Saccharibacteria bacterium]|nr:hypothetical protein [Candidatus Saccharibacteria bacterium]